MTLSQGAVEEFKRIYQEEFGVALSHAEAREMGERLLRLLQVLSRPLPPATHDAPDAPDQKPSTP